MGKGHFVHKVGISWALVTASALAENAGKIVLYQIGQRGNYCISLTKEASGCISGVNPDGNTINLLDVVKGHEVVFENLSDAYHDMKFTGANAEDLPPQAPNASIARKEMRVADLEKQKITCSFHGDQLGVGYRVPEKMEATNTGHGAPPPGGIVGEGGSILPAPFTPPRPIVRTGLADVSGFILKNGVSSEVNRLITMRPELAIQYKGELAARGIPPGSVGSVKSGSVNSPLALGNVGKLSADPPDVRKMTLKNAGTSAQKLESGMADLSRQILAQNKQGKMKQAKLTALSPSSLGANAPVASSHPDLPRGISGGPASGQLAEAAKGRNVGREQVLGRKPQARQIAFSNIQSKEYSGGRTKWLIVALGIALVAAYLLYERANRKRTLLAAAYKRKKEKI